MVSRRGIIIAIILFSASAAAYFWYVANQNIFGTSTNDALTITFLDIGQGDATYIKFPGNKDMLVDCAIDARILEALGRHMSFFDRTINYLVVTHPDRDHYGGCVDVLKQFTINTIVLNGFEKPDDPYFEFFAAAVTAQNTKIITIEKEQTWDLGETVVHFLYPDHAIQQNSAVPGEPVRKDDSNNTSIVFELAYHGAEILLTADAEAPLEAYLVKTYGQTLDADILKAGHHGSTGSTSEPFLTMVSPTDVVFSAGKKNTYGHPSGRILKRVERADATIWRTDTQGDITMTVHRNGTITRQAQFSVRY